uniref:Uncharacterized protein n=1 Tax=Lepeophtheirus salmonis TaxID=72036 RepID=A0A0K2VF57_LEPSM
MRAVSACSIPSLTPSHWNFHLAIDEGSLSSRPIRLLIQPKAPAEVILVLLRNSLLLFNRGL